MASPTGASWEAYERQQTAKAKAKARKKTTKSPTPQENNEKIIAAYRKIMAQKKRGASSRRTGR